MIVSFSGESNATVDDDVSDKTSNSLTHKTSNVQSVGQGNQIISSLILKIY